MRPILLSIILLGCAPKLVPPAAQESTPVLPAIEADVYTLAPTPPADFLVAEIAKDLPFDEALAGAAAGLAILIGENTSAGFDSADLTWACIRAGWPYPLSDMRSLSVDKDERPEGLLAALSLHDSSRIGLARARSATSDTWVYLQSEVSQPAQPFSKTHTLGASFSNPFGTESSVKTHLLSPSGKVLDLVKKQRLNESGEWLLQSHLEGAPILLAALFVDMKAPQKALLPFQEANTKPDSPAALAATLLSEMHKIFFDTDQGLQREASLDTLARIALRAWQNDEALPAAHVRFEKLGYVREPRGEILCTGESVRACLDNLFWSIPLRKVLLSEKHKSVGIAAHQSDTGQLTLMINLASN